MGQARSLRGRHRDRDPSGLRGGGIRRRAHGWTRRAGESPSDPSPGEMTIRNHTTKEIRTMRFFMYTLGDENVPLPPPTPELFVEMGAFMEEATKSGALIETGGFAPSALGAKVALADGKFSVTDGPFSEAKELIGGWALCELSSKEEAIDYAKRFLKIVGGGESRIRQVFGPEDGAPR